MAPWRFRLLILTFISLPALAQEPAAFRLNFDIEVKARVPSATGNGCEGTRLSRVPAGYVDLCDPDPVEKVCAEITEHDLEKERQFVASFLEKHNKAVEAITPLALKDMPSKLVGATGIEYQEALNKIIETKYAGKLQEMLGEQKVREVLGRHLDTFEKAIRSSTLLRADDVEVIVSRIRNCASNLRLAAGVEEFDVSVGGAIEKWFRLSEYGHGRFYKSVIEDSSSSTRKINLVAGDLPLKCGLDLSLATWERCQRDEPICAQVVFHELAHIIDSCTMISLARNADRQARSYPITDQRVDIFKKQSKAASALAVALGESVSCLEQISAPKFAILDACEAETKSSEATRDLYRRCPAKNDPANRRKVFQDPQWVEAEADFWSATALSRFLVDRFPSIEGRKRALFSAQKAECATYAKFGGRMLWIKELRRKAKAGNTKFRYADIRGKPTPDAYGKLAVAQYLGSPITKVPLHQYDKQKDCRQRPDPIAWQKASSGGTVDIESDSHQASGKRFDRNFLRNADLRRVLGCKLSKDVPVACSPLGYVNSVLIQ